MSFSCEKYEFCFIKSPTFKNYEWKYEELIKKGIESLREILSINQLQIDITTNTSLQKYFKNKEIINELLKIIKTEMKNSLNHQLSELLLQNIVNVFEKGNHFELPTLHEYIFKNEIEFVSELIKEIQVADDVTICYILDILYHLMKNNNMPELLEKEPFPMNILLENYKIQIMNV